MASTIHRSPAYLSRNKYGYCFRVKVPEDLHDFLGKKELRYSLKTGYLGVAKTRARFLAGNVQMLLNFVRQGGGPLKSLSPDVVHDLIRKYRDQAIEEAEKPINPFENRPIYRRLLGDDERHKKFQDGTDLFDYLDTLNAYKEALRYWAGTGEYQENDTQENAEKLCQENEIQYDIKSPEFSRLCRDMLLADVAAIEAEMNKMEGNPQGIESATWAIQNHDQNPNEEADAKPEVDNQHGISDTSRDLAQQTSAAVKQAADAFFEEFNRDWKPRSRTDYKNAVDQIVEGLGPDTQLHTIDYNTVKAYRDGLRDGSLSKNNKALSVSRVNFFLATIKRIFNLAMKQDRNLDRINPADGLQLRDKRKPNEKRDVFTDDELKAIFVDSKEYGQDKHTKAANFWVPLLGLYTGARLDELCQLLIEDVAQREGIWCLDIRDDNSKWKSVKTGERRIVPLHPFITEDLRFPEFVQSIDQRKKRVFPELVYVNNRWGHGLGQWFGRFKKRVGIESGKGMKTFHSFRHTLINHLKQNDAGKDYVKEFVGHSSGVDMSWDVYGKQFVPAKLMEKVVMKLDYGIDLSHLKKSQYVVK